MPTSKTLDKIVQEPTSAVQGAVIWLHGLGASADDFAGIQRELGLTQHLRFIFPNAPMQPVTINQGYVMPAWYDIYGLGFGVREDAEGIQQSGLAVSALIDEQIAAGIAADKIYLVGFSQGGAIALHAGLRYPQRLAGIIGLSTYLPLSDRLAAERHAANQSTPVMLAQGTDDDVVLPAWAEASRDALLALHYQVQWHTYPMAHNVCPQEIIDIANFIN